VLGAFEKFEEGKEQPKWQVSLSWRYQRSDRHFVGTDEQEERKEEGSQVINDINLLDIGIRYNVSDRTSVSVGIPYLMATRSMAIRDANRVIVGRNKVAAHGIGDITVVGRRLLFDPTKHYRSNVSLGFGLKLPTGQDNVVDTRVRIADGEYVRSIETVDQSIQPGDGGFGVVVDVSAFQQLGGSRAALYESGTYLFNPQDTNGVQTYRGRESESEMSVADQYLLRAGVQAAPESWNGFGVGLGLRLEVVPVHDVFGGSDGFRRPGYGFSAEPSLTWSRGPHSLSLAIAWALERNRQRSVPDIRDGRAGDAAFADWVAFFGYWRRF